MNVCFSRVSTQSCPLRSRPIPDMSPSRPRRSFNGMARLFRSGHSGWSRSQTDRAKTLPRRIPARRNAWEDPICLTSPATTDPRPCFVREPGSKCRSGESLPLHDACVDGLDSTAAGFIRVASKLTGRPEYPRPAPIDHHIYAALRSSISPNRNSRSSTSNAAFCASSLSAMLARWALRCCNSTIRSSTVSAAISL
jgi:hypothetical protein